MLDVICLMVNKKWLFLSLQCIHTWMHVCTLFAFPFVCYLFLRRSQREWMKFLFGRYFQKKKVTTYFEAFPVPLKLASSVGWFVGFIAIGNRSKKFLKKTHGHETLVAMAVTDTETLVCPCRFPIGLVTNVSATRRILAKRRKRPTYMPPKPPLRLPRPSNRLPMAGAAALAALVMRKVCRPVRFSVSCSVSLYCSPLGRQLVR